MRVMTFNLRFENDQDGENAWIYRRDLVIKLIMKYAPDILGTQEGRQTQLEYLQKNLPDYTMHAPRSRVWDDTCQYPTLFIRRSTTKILEGGELWLSKTPETHRSKNWDSAFPRMISHAKVELINLRKIFHVAVTHLDHMGETARLKQAEMIARWVGEQSKPVILMGDFNDSPESKAHQALTGPETGLNDSWQIMGFSEGEAGFSHHGFTGKPQQARIDWILNTRPPDVTHVRMVHDAFGSRYASDHFPVYADFSWT